MAAPVRESISSVASHMTGSACMAAAFSTSPLKVLIGG